MNRFAGKVAVVTGAASGIGRATAIRLGSEGAAVACLDLASEAATATAARIAQDGGRAIGIACDVSAPGSVTDAVGAAVDEFGPPDVVCNIAGIGRFYHSVDMSPEDWARIIAVNLTGTFLVCQAALRHMLGRGGVIVNTASTSGVMAQPYQAAYCASKGGVVMLTKALAIEYWDRKVRINAICPGGVDTPIIKDFSELPEGADMNRLTRYMSPMGFCQPEDLASLFAYVASDEAHYMTGSIVTMDGGITL
ncbi:MAG TPA: SDR family NAD(P)-dependent oxidoreductase [Acidimicrobiales bacterium]|nr:SDR family NAD(P)-dependent oxidoreductase [Acidimicrobiales bacterium]